MNLLQHSAMKEREAKSNEVVRQQQLALRDDIIQFSHDLISSARKNRVQRKSLFNQGRINISIDSKTSNMRHTFLPTTLKEDEKSGAKQCINIHINRPNMQSNSSACFEGHRYSKTKCSKISKTHSMQIEKMQKVNPLQSKEFGTTEAPIASSQDIVTHRTRNSKLVQTAPREKSISYGEVERKHNRRNLSDVSVQSWLNEALIEGSPNLRIDRNQESSGLKAYSIDRSSLLRLGINPADISRLYKSFFVYSLGFNTLLKEVSQQNKELRNTVWRVFAILLQYCSGGNFQTMIGELERDKQSKLRDMRLEIQKRQKIIEENDELSDKKNGKIMKEIRELQDKKRQLEQERQVILQDFHEAEQAFNQQIALRLKYQTKINEIHGVYEQLRHKNSLLKEDHQRNLMEIDKIKKVNQKLRENLSLSSGQLSTAAMKITNLEGQIELIHGNLENLSKQSYDSNINRISIKKSCDSYLHLLHEKSRKIQQLQLTFKNMQSTEKRLLLLVKSKTQQFERAMKENAELHENNQKSLVIINELMEQNRTLGHKNTEAITQRELGKRKLEEKQKIIANSQAKLEEAAQSLRLKQISLLAEKQRSLALEKDLHSNELNIKQMKAKQNQLSSILDESTRKIAMLEQRIEFKNSEVQKYSIQIQQLKQTVQEKKTELKQKQSKMLILEQSIKAQFEVAEVKYSKLEEEYNSMKTESAKYHKEREMLVGEVEEAKEKYEKIYNELKNEKFERNNLNLYYQQSLSVMEEEISHIKKLNIKISELTEANQQSQRKYQALEMTHKSKTQFLQKDVQFWKSQFHFLEKQFKQKKSFIHPLLFEDVCESFLRLQEKSKTQSQIILDYENKKKQIGLEKLKIAELSKKRQQKSSNQDLVIRLKNQIEKKEAQMNFMRNKTQYLEQKCGEWEANSLKAKNQKISAEQTLRKIESEMMERIRLKNKELSDLNEKYRILLDVNSEQLQENERLSGKYESQRRQLSRKIQNLTDQLKSHSEIQGKAKNQHRKHAKEVEHEKQREKGMVPAIEESQFQKNGWNSLVTENLDEDELFKLESKEQAPNMSHTNLIPHSEQAQPCKKREEIRKKIKGAYLYYCK